MKKAFCLAVLLMTLLTIIGCKSLVEIKSAPIHQVDIRFAESFPVQIFVYIQGGLSDGCTTFKDLKTSVSGSDIKIDVRVQRTKNAICTALYSYFEKNVALGSDFVSGQTYTVTVNDVVKTFVMP
ncbi:MAG: hypothetical protein PHE50_03855 [Dehalococcoidales bacterium]|nr:hypothetical protein [Dehalococcoidales bacterium]